MIIADCFYTRSEPLQGPNLVIFFYIGHCAPYGGHQTDSPRDYDPWWQDAGFYSWSLSKPQQWHVRPMECRCVISHLAHNRQKHQSYTNICVFSYDTKITALQNFNISPSTRIALNARTVSVYFYRHTLDSPNNIELVVKVRMHNSSDRGPWIFNQHSNGVNWLSKNIIDLYLS